MKYSVEVEINAPLDRVIELFDSTENLKEWQPELVSFDHTSGAPGEVGSVSNMVYKMGKRDYAMTETITAKNLPDEFAAIYEGPGMWNASWNTFQTVDENTTKWVANHEFKSDKLLFKAMLFFTPGAFKKESLKFMNNFKDYVESQPASPPEINHDYE